MPLRYFDCPDGVRRAIEVCLTKCPRPEGRCLPLPVLIQIGRTREWAGKPSTTQLINGTRLAYLQIVKDYAVKPFGRAFPLLGTRHHFRLEKIAQKLNVLGEEKLDGEITSIIDLIEPDETMAEEAYILWDYKTSGSYKVAMALGLVPTKVIDPSGAVYTKSGKWGKKGEPKMITVYERDFTKADTWDWELQDNHYRIKIEPLGFPISKMFNLLTVRDGNTVVALNRGVTEEMYVLPIKRLPDGEVLNYFGMKRAALLTALTNHKLPAPCNEKECWEGRRCREGNCDVAEFCDRAKK